MNLSLLADRVEALEGPDRALNREVALAVGWGRRTPSEIGRRHPGWFHPDDCRNGVPVLDSLHGTEVWREPLDYLASIDAAMSLVPEGWFIANLAYDWRVDRWRSTVCRLPSKDQRTVFEDFGTIMLDDAKGEAATSALALTAAALRSRDVS